MKVINHQKNNYKIIDTYIYRGTIEMTPLEYKKAMDFLKKEYTKALKNIDTYTRDSLNYMKHYTGNIHNTPINMFSLGVCAIKLLFKRYKLKNYKKQNYTIFVK